jgi:hypothetical protein
MVKREDISDINAKAAVSLLSKEIGAKKTPIEAQALAVFLYGMGNSSYGFIAKLLNVSRTAVYHWICNFCEDVPPPVVPEGNYDIEFDEMWHFINSKKQTLDLESSGSCSKENRCLGYRQS